MKTKHLLFFLPFVFALAIGTEAFGVCKAQFKHKVTKSTAKFTNSSKGINTQTTYLWTFGDGQQSSSKNPTHDYHYNGTYIACLTIIDSSANCYSTFCDSIVITKGMTPPPPCEARFTANKTNNTVSFSNTSSGGTGNIPFFWTFGDGNYSNMINPTHVYTYNGTYLVCLTMGDSLSTQCFSRYCDTVVVTGGINQPCNAAFYFGTDSISTKTYFYDASSGSINSWSWSFGDGSYSSLQNPIHQYTQAGAYNVCLTVINSNADTCSYCSTIFIKGNGSSCQAGFTFNKNNNAVTFNNTSLEGSNNIHYSWTFGDGSFSNVKNPTHVYPYNGNYIVCLTMNDSIAGTCYSTFCDSVLITDTINQPCNANFYQHVDSLITKVHFYDDPSNNAIAWLWYFGDGTTSNVQNPVHMYTQAGTYSVCLTTFTNQQDSCYDCHIVVINPIVGCSANFYLHQDSLNPQTWYVYPHVAGTAPFSYSWNFGDGYTTTQQYPTHTYASPGYYQICLTVTDSKGCSITFCDTTRRIAANSMIGKIVVVDVTTSVKDNPVIINSTYPNPASDILNIVLNEPVLGEVRFVDITGREVLREKFNTKHISINISNLPTGLYDVSVVSGNQISHNKVCIKK